MAVRAGTVCACARSSIGSAACSSACRQRVRVHGSGGGSRPHLRDADAPPHEREVNDGDLQKEEGRGGGVLAHLASAVAV